MAMIISPASKNGVESVNQLRLCEAARGFANGFYFVLDRPERTSARSDLYLAEMTLSASMLPNGLTQKVKAFADVGYLGLLLRELNASQFQEVVYLWDDIVPQYYFAGCRDDESSHAGESHPHVLTEPYVNLSAHTAPTVQPPPDAAGASAQRASDHDAQWHESAAPNAGGAASGERLCFIQKVPPVTG